METAESSKPKLEYNLAGGLLLTIRERDLEQLTNELVSSGYRYGCVLPFRGLTKTGSVEKLKNSPMEIVHLEEAWNPANKDNFTLAVLAGLYGHWKRYRGDKTEPPILQDAFFPSKNSCDRLFKELYGAFPGVKFISHSFETNYPSDRLLVEINPGIELSPKEILHESQCMGVGLVFDPRHLLNTERTISVAGEPTKPDMGEWERQFNQFASQIEVVDINPPKPDDVQDLLKERAY